MKTRILLVLWSCGLACAVLAQTPTYQGTFSHHTVIVNVGGLCQSPDLSFTNTYQQSALSVPIEFTSSEICSAVFGFEGSLNVNFPATTPSGTIPAGQTLRFDPAWPLNVTAGGDWSFPGEPINNPRELVAWLTLSGQQSNFTFCTQVEQRYGPGLSAGTYSVSLLKDCPVAAMTSPTQQGNELIYNIPTSLDLFVFARSNPPGSRILFSINVEVRSYYRVNTAAGMEVLPPRLDFEVPSDDMTQSLTVRNTGSSNLNFSASTGPANWLIVLPATGTIAPQQTTNLTVFLDDELVPPGPTNIGTITVSGNAANSPRTVTVYAVRGSNILNVIDRSPAGAILTAGEEVSFSTEVEYQLATAESGELVLEVLDSRGQLIASTGPRPISRLAAPARATLAMSAITVQRAWTNATLRVQMIANGVVQMEATQTVPYQVLDPDEQFLRVIRVVEDAEVRVPGGDWIEPQVGMQLRPGTQISTGPDAELHLLFPDSTVMVVKGLTEVLVNTLLRQGNAVKAQVLLKLGEISAQVNPEKVVTSDFSVSTPVATTSVRGTTFTVRHVAQPEPVTTLIVSNGVVEFIPRNGALPTLTVGSNQTAQITAMKITGPGAPVITALGAESGVAGTQLTISGANFSATPASNLVSFGGFHGDVVSASANQLTVVIPDSLATAVEPVTVTVNGLTSNATNFFVTAARAATVVSGNVTGVWTRAQSPYMIGGDAAVPTGGTLRVEPGVVVTMQYLGSHLFVAGILVAEGTNGAPIRFTSLSTNKAPGQWGAVVVQDSSDDAQTRLVNCTFEYGGYFQQGTLELHSAFPRLEGITVRGSSANGLFLGDSTVGMTNCVFSENVNAAILMDVASFPLLRGTFATRNGFDGIGVLSGAFTRSGTWINDGGVPYRLYSDVEITSTNTLTIQPGATIELADINGDLFVNGTLRAIGSPGALITFTADGTNAVRGQWAAIIIGPSSTNTMLEHCVVERGGYFRGGAIEVNGASPTIRNCVIGSSSWHGLWMSGASKARVIDCTFVNNALSAMSMTPDCFPVVGNNAASSNGANSIAIQGGVVPTSGTWLRDSIPYTAQTDVTIASNAVLTIAPGTTVQMADINGDLFVDGALVARGAASQPILFTTDDVPPAPGRWAAIIIRDSSDDALTVLEHCFVEYGSYFRGGSIEILNASPTLAHTTVRRSSWHGISLVGSAARISECHFESNALYAALMDVASFPLVTNNTAIGNGGNAIGVAGGMLNSSGVWQRGGLPYALVTDVTVATGHTLTIAPGNTIQSSDINGDLIVDGVLDARGTVTRPIRFTSDDVVKAPGQWAAILLRNGAAPSLFEHCTIEAGGYFRNGSIELLGASPLISDCTIQLSSWHGLFAQNSSSVVQRSRFTQNAQDGIRVDGTAGFRVHQSVLASNNAFGLRNLTTQVVPAQSNYWGHASGPFDNANTDGLGLLNPSGTGDEVSEYVQWSAFLTSEPAGPSAPELRLAIERGTGNDIVLSWDSALSDAVLERADGLGGTNAWTAAGLTPTNAGGRARLTLQPGSSSRFFRLRQ